jgi:hypothetical protein
VTRSKIYRMDSLNFAASNQSHIIRFRHCSLFQVVCKQRSADIYHHKFEEWYRNAVVTKQPLDNISHTNFPFPRDRFLRQLLCTAEFWVNFFQKIFCGVLKVVLAKPGQQISWSFLG